MTAGNQGQRITDFVAELIGAMGLRLAATADEQPDHVRIDLQGDDKKSPGCL